MWAVRRWEQIVRKMGIDELRLGEEGRFWEVVHETTLGSAAREPGCIKLTMSLFRILTYE